MKQKRAESVMTLPKINKKAQIRDRLINLYQNDIPTIERKVQNYKKLTIPDNDPFFLFKIVQLPNTNDLSAFCHTAVRKPRKESSRESARAKRYKSSVVPSQSQEILGMRKVSLPMKEKRIGASTISIGHFDI